MNNSNKYNPDVLTCLANLSNDEVFTPPSVVNKMLDLLPQELFENPNTTFLDPATKTGVFLREIAKRLIDGLKDKIPDEQKRIDHIFKNQIFGIAITELTGLLSRRSVYCSKEANSNFSITRFNDKDGNIRYKKILHSWANNKCIYCGASYDELNRDTNLETHAYEFIHRKNEEDIFNMKFDVIISNPPYQLNDGGGMGSSAKPIYNLFIKIAKKLKPRYISMIIPSRWMTGGKGLDDFRKEMINDKHIRVLHDFSNSEECFSGVTIKGGVCYFLRDEYNPGKCHIFRHTVDGQQESIRYLKNGDDDIYIRDEQLISIKNKVWKNKNQDSLMNIIFSRKSYGVSSNFLNDSSNIKKYSISDVQDGNKIAIWGLQDLKRVKKYANKNANITQSDNINKYKVLIAKAYGCGEIGEVASTPILSTPILSTPILSTPNEICTETFLEIGSFDNQIEARNIYIYIYKAFSCFSWY